ncbi:hypothetical protein [Algoriphagus halophytocola]|uniref:Uncharacterized protein n=1 Tax=Algoriphagus halophytocola TaxID=2991499 RepID=A0ABY6MGR2_9BACT|nr:hypothetical protein [Algoriphagus sp. TR-M5]UZD22982.1 hypothetical protein OM944_00505 [Algoriphagus sp. TR-M5]
MILLERRIIYAKDIMVLTGRSKSYAYNNLKKVREWLGKSKDQLVTFDEYAEFHGISVSDVFASVVTQ